MRLLSHGDDGFDLEKIVVWTTDRSYLTMWFAGMSAPLKYSVDSDKARAALSYLRAASEDTKLPPKTP